MEKVFFISDSFLADTHKTIPHDGYAECILESFDKLLALCSSAHQQLNEWIFRGQENVIWKLESSLDRFLRNKNGSVDRETRERAKYTILNAFKKHCCGRLSEHPELLTTPDKEDEDLWWALGRHYGLYTPLLDWTGSLGSALFFAAIPNNKENTDRALFALNKKQHVLHSNSDYKLNFAEPLMNGNVRLVAQSGLFTQLLPLNNSVTKPFEYTIESWVQNYYKTLGLPKDKSEIILIKFIISQSIREETLQLLSSMNTNYVSLFPDLSGSALHSNYLLEKTLRSTFTPR